MTPAKPRAGYTLPVFACAAAVAALRCLREGEPVTSVSIDLIEPPQTADIEIEQVAVLQQGMALAIARSDPGDNLDLTRNTPIWALVELSLQDHLNSEPRITIQGGEGIGRIVNAGDKAAIYSYAQKLLPENLRRFLQLGESIQVTIILPEGRSLATRTSNSAFGVVDGLSLLGTTGISQPLSAPGQLDTCIEELRNKASITKNDKSQEEKPLVFCIGENGIDLTQKLGIKPERIIKTANWLGPMLVEAGVQQVQSLLLFGYHGKLIKLAGGIFHTHHHLADGRLEIFTAQAARVGVPTSVLQDILNCATVEDALKYLRALDNDRSSNWTEKVYHAIAEQIDRRSQDYIRKHSQYHVSVGSVLFDRDRKIIISSQIGASLLSQLC